MNRHAKCDAASFILSREIRNRTNTHTHTHTTVNDISTPCLSACVDRNANTFWEMIQMQQQDRCDLTQQMANTVNGLAKWQSGL